MISLAVLLIVSIYASWVDSAQLIIPDSIISFSLVLILLLSFLEPFPVSAGERLGGMLFGGGQLYTARILSKYRMGMGDVKYALVLGGLIGIKAWVVASVIASLLALGTVFMFSLKNKLILKEKIPFAPFLGMGSLLGWILVLGDNI